MANGLIRSLAYVPLNRTHGRSVAVVYNNTKHTRTITLHRTQPHVVHTVFHLCLVLYNNIVQLSCYHKWGQAGREDSAISEIYHFLVSFDS